MAPESQPDAWQVICLCAEWCGVCRDYRAVFDRASRANPQARFLWVDIEDEADAMGDMDVETFPTLLIARGGHVHFLGPVLPSAEHVGRLLASLESTPPPAVDTQANDLLERLMARGSGTDEVPRGDV